MRKRISVLLVLVLILSALMPSGFAGAKAAEPQVSKYGDVADIGPWLRFQAEDEELRTDLDAQIRAAAANFNFDEEPAGDGTEAESTFTYDGGTKFFLGLDSVDGSYYFKPYTLRSVGEDVEVWVADDIAYLEGDSRDDPVITQEQVDLMRDEFDGNIYPTDTDFFGMPDYHDGEFSLLDAWGYVDPGYYNWGDKNIILVDNVRDESFYDDTYPFFIAGFYSPTYEAYFDRNIITIDTNQWETRLESTYFGVTAHEYQHLIHDDNDSAETTWLNEGMSDFAEYLCGYGHPEGHVQFFLDHPENSLVEWDEHYNADTGPEVLADYGQAYLLQLYLHDQYGKEFTRALATSPSQGFASIDEVLADFGAGIDFEEAFRRFCVAVAIDAPQPGKGIYEFTSIDLFAEPFTGLSFESAEYYDKDGVPAWGGDYKHLDNMTNIKGVIFDGIDFLPSPWVEVEESPASGGAALYSNYGDEKDNMLIFPVDLTDAVDPVLNFNTWYDIEDYWDFAFVQVSTDNGQTWTSLENEHTTYDYDPSAYPAIIDQLPGLTSWTEDWVAMTFDLADYAGQEVHIAFRYMTDWATYYEGWYVKDIEIPGIDLGLENGSLDGFTTIYELLENYVEYQVVFLSKTGNRVSQVITLDPMDVTEMDAIKLKQLLSAGDTYMIVWYPAPVGTKGYVDFTYEFLTPQDMKNIPALPYGPEDPFGPDNPDGPDDPGDPIGPDDPIDPDKPNKPEHPVHPDNPGLDAPGRNK